MSQMDTSQIDMSEMIGSDDQPLELPIQPPILVRGAMYIAPRINIQRTNEFPSGKLLINDWCLRENPIFFVSPHDLMEIARVLFKDINRYLAITSAEDCELYWACGGGKYGEQLMSAVVKYFQNYTGVLTENMNTDLQTFFGDLNEYADYPRNLVLTQYGYM